MSQPTQEEMDGKMMLFSCLYRWNAYSCGIINEPMWCHFTEFRDAFSLFDTKGDGKIDCEQIGSVLRSLNLNPDDEDIVKIEKDVGK